MIPIPNYLKPYASEQTQKGNRLFFKLKCTCGCEAFTILEKDYTSNEKKVLKEYENSIPNTGWHSVYGEQDSNGNTYNYIKILGIFKKHITFPPRPMFMEVNVIKVICSQCQKEIVLFDSRYHGYDGMTANNEEVKKYIPLFKQRGNKSYDIIVSIENELSLEDYHENLNEQFNYDFYTNSFSSISIYKLAENGKKILLYDFETA